MTGHKHVVRERATGVATESKNILNPGKKAKAKTRQRAGKDQPGWKGPVSKVGAINKT